MRIPVFLLILATAGHGLAAVPVVPAAVQGSIRQRVDYGYNAGIAVGMVNVSGRAFFSYGVGNLESRQVITENTLFEIGSVTKVFTSTLLARLVQTDDASLTDRIQDYLPVFHEGNTMGQSAFIGYRRNTKTAVVVLTNARVNQHASIQAIALNLLGYPIRDVPMRCPAPTSG